MAEALAVWVGTRKGAFVFRTKDRRKWQIEGPFFKGWEVNHISQDERDPKRLYAAVNSAWFGPHLHRSVDGGKSWQLAEKGLELRGIKGETLKRIWHVRAGHPDEPKAVYAGGDPGALFQSADWGENWELVTSLTKHPTRSKWAPGAGGMCLHSIQCLGNGHMAVAISAAGVFRSKDRGKNWEPFNQGVRADFLPKKFPEVGQCVHKLLAHPRDPQRLYQQNHCGVYRGKLDGKKWTDISRGLPSRFGFGLAVPASEPDTLFTVPMESAEYRANLNGRLSVARSRDGGKSWKLLSRGLPEHNAHVLVLREAMTSDALSPAGIYFGGSTGTVYYSRDAGENWSALAENLPAVYSVSVAQ